MMASTVAIPAAHRTRLKTPEPGIADELRLRRTSQQTDRPARKRRRNDGDDHEPRIARERASLFEHAPQVQYGDEGKESRGRHEVRLHRSLRKGSVSVWRGSTAGPPSFPSA